MNKFFEIKKDSPIIIDTCIFMVGIEKRQADSAYSLDSMKKNWMNDVLSYFENIKLHEVVYGELQLCQIVIHQIPSQNHVSSLSLDAFFLRSIVD